MIIKKIKSSYFAKTFDLLKKNPDNLFLIFIFDIWFLAALLILAKFTQVLTLKFLVPSFSTQPSIALALAFNIAYYLAILFIYSFFKYIVLHYLKRMFVDTKINFKRLGNFFLLNLIIFISFFIIFIVLNGLLLLNVKRQVAPFVFLLIFIPFVFFSYAMINIAHTLFINLTAIKDILRKTIKVTFSDIKSYAGIYLSSIMIFSIYYLIYYLIVSSVSKTGSFITYYSTYLTIFSILTSIVFYLIIFFNRAYFNLIVKEKFLKKD